MNKRGIHTTLEVHVHAFITYVFVKKLFGKRELMINPEKLGNARLVEIRRWTMVKPSADNLFYISILYIIVIKNV